MSRGIRILPARCPEKTDDWVIVFSFCFFFAGVTLKSKIFVGILSEIPEKKYIGFSMNF